ncbi:phosphoketolase [Curtobacterium sp. BH-2-1-1]|uniref:phosphoketolase family protein n=1 Tax=Curtobacterium sp. BH-2-1-1 TaxID=1905847 RepID=UPI00089E0072|nr:phosphoketolase family protein [Curtobacterium sp. BH-2-1-1]AOX67181.1 phosphoketolase [Curtobacterium sp. BH-2-1-1]
MDDTTIEQVHRWWRAANYLAVGQIYLLDDPLLRRPLTPEDVKPRLLGHWGTTPGLNFVHAHLNRVIRERALRTLFVCGPGHGGPAVVANAWLDGTYSELYPAVTQDEDGMRRLFRQFSFPGGIPSHAAPQTPGSMHEGGELGYALSHAYGAAFDDPTLLVAAVVGDGEAETGPLATSWHSNKFVDPLRDGVVLPILHLNGYKIANPTVLARIPESELIDLMRGYGHQPFVVSGGFDGEDPQAVHRRMAETLDVVLDEIERIRRAARTGTLEGRPRWPMIVLRTPKGWTCPPVIDGKPAEDSWRSHQVPLSDPRHSADHLAVLEEWMRSYRPEELFGPDGSPASDIRAHAPAGDLRMSANPVANGGLVRTDLRMPDFRDQAVAVERPGATSSEPTRVLGRWLAAVARANPTTFRVFGPDETASNRLDALYDVTDKQWNAEVRSTDEHLAPHGRVMEMLSEHQCEGWLEGYLLTGRHGVFGTYEAFAHVVDSMLNQHAKWLAESRKVPWRRPVSSLNYLLSSHVWRQDHNGLSHQDPGFIDHVMNKRPEVVRVYLPFDTNTLLSTFDHCLRSVDYVNVVVAGKQPTPDLLTAEEAVAHCTRGLGILPWAGTEVDGEEPNVVLACAGDVPTLEVLAAASILRDDVPGLRVRVVNVVDLMRLTSPEQHPHGMPDEAFDALFTRDRPVVFAFHGYPWLIHRLTYRRAANADMHVRGYVEQGTTTTPFDMLMLNDLDRFHLVIDVLDRVPGLAVRYAGLRQRMQDARTEARAWTRSHGEDVPSVADWRWSA